MEAHFEMNSGHIKLVIRLQVSYCAPITPSGSPINVSCDGAKKIKSNHQ